MLNPTPSKPLHSRDSSQINAIDSSKVSPVDSSVVNAKVSPIVSSVGSSKVSPVISSKVSPIGSSIDSSCDAAHQVVIAFGSNMGDSVSTLKQACAHIAALEGVKLIKTSSFYQTKPWGYAEQNDFINGVMLVETTLSPTKLYEHLTALEQEFGRKRLFKNGPRTLDLDIVVAGDIISDNPLMTLPHPRAHERAFVLVPLNEIAPDLIFPDRKQSVSELLALLPQQDKAEVMRLPD